MQLDLELYREEVVVSTNPEVVISLIDVAPERPDHTLVLLHGFGGRASQWRYQIEAFAERNRVLAIDLRGHGRSSRPLSGYEMPRLLQDLVAVLNARRVTGPFILVGHSFGGAVATEFALLYPERVNRLILVASAGEYELRPLYQVAFRLPDPLLLALQPLVGGLVDASLPALKRFYRQNLSRWRGWDKFPQLKPPAMIIMGERDIVFPQAAFARVAELMPEAEVINVGVSAHMVMLERRDAVNRAIERFVEAEAAHSWRDDGRRPGTSSLLAERPWLAHYESGVPHTLDVPRLALTRLLSRAWRRFPRRPAILFQGKTLRYKSLSAQAGRLANALQSLGVGQGTRVMLLLPNVPHLVIAYYGILRLGGVVVMGNPLARKDEVIREARESGAEVLITLARFEEVALAVREQSGVRHVIFAALGDYLPVGKQLLLRLGLGGGPARLGRPLALQDHEWRPLLRRHKPKPPEVEVSPFDPAVIQFTGGTTAVPKGVTLTHYNLVANTFQTRAWLPGARDGEEVILCVVPFSHVYGMTTAMNLAVSIGASMILLPVFDTEEVLQHIRAYRPTLFPGVPAMYVAINNFPGVRKYNVRSIRACISGAAPLPVEVKEAFEKLTKGKLVEGYGLSEASPATHANPINGLNKAGSIGIPLPNTEARIVDLRTGQPLPAGQIGELVVRGPQVMLGYWQDEAASRQALDADGWLHTNDVARLDEDGYFQIISRRQDMWTAEDETPAFPRDVEEVIYELPEVREVVVVAIANQPIAFVSVKERAKVPAKTIIAFCQRRLPPGQVPRLVIFVKDFPRSFIGKVLRRELVSQYEHEIKAEAGTVGEHLAGLEE
ncbi:MAG: alpha/beta fold hydrolase [Chloroflexi bacterium]|nr:alpha/beta fold hydrolase [Chloroflexota bacterium]MCI0579131.1 alpha/beta fold hydrolase [Chloroflexota bacterium]MCI0643348.1 alpha/beta fold hydrolase [Chloroflexota bacterium]MCI0728327.1 alpha/beta fold hydrolase [Chloroflexota bacterium]